MAGASTVAGTDVEAIQNQIDLSLSLAFDLVASWSIPKNEDASESILSSAPDADDLMQWLNRPPRWADRFCFCVVETSSSYFTENFTQSVWKAWRWGAYPGSLRPKLPFCQRNKYAETQAGTQLEKEYRG